MNRLIEAPPKPSRGGREVESSLVVPKGEAPAKSEGLARLVEEAERSESLRPTPPVPSSRPAASPRPYHLD